MTAQARDWAWEQPVKGGLKLVLLALAERSDIFGVTYIGQATAAAMTGLSPRAVSENMAKLEQDGIIARFRRARGNGSRTSDWIVLAPLDVDRGRMEDHPADGRPEPVIETARRPHADSAHDESAGPKVQKRGGPEPTEEPTGERERVGVSARTDFEAVWAHYQLTRPNGTQCKLDPARGRIIVEALKVRSVGECCLAIDGLFKSEYHVLNGYNGIKYALRGGGRSPEAEDTIDRMGKIARGELVAAPRGGQRPSSGDLIDRIGGGL